MSADIEPQIEPLEEAPATESRARRDLPFTYAQQYGVLLDETADGSPLVVHTGQLQLQVLTELRRHLGGPFALQSLSEEDFKRRLTLAYQRTDNEAVQMAEDIGSEVYVSPFSFSAVRSSKNVVPGGSSRLSP